MTAQELLDKYGETIQYTDDESTSSLPYIAYMTSKYYINGLLTNCLFAKATHSELTVKSINDNC